MNDIMKNWEFLPAPSEKNLPLSVFENQNTIIIISILILGKYTDT